ncbi:MAG: hypothetical protein ACYS8W_11420 [Planctomycetota bacterium]
MCSLNPPEHRECCHKFSEHAVDKLKKFADRGGFIFTEDWGMADLLERAWGNLVKSGTYLPEKDIDVFPERGATTHPLMRGVFVTEKKIIKEKDPGANPGGARPGEVTEDEENPETGKGLADGGPKTAADPGPQLEEILKKLVHKWHVDDESPNIHVANKTKVTILMSSKDVAKERGGQGAVAITFGGLSHGISGEGRYRTGGGQIQRGQGVPLGRILHVLSHLGRQNCQDDEFALRNLVLNFLIEAREVYQMMNRNAQKKK